jgi:hypothetical protein
MATLQTPGDVKSVKFIDLPATDQVAGIWTVTLRSSSDTIVVPGLESTNGVGSLKATTTVTAAAISAGQTTVTIAAGAAGDVFTFATLHRPGALNNLSRDGDPT